MLKLRRRKYSRHKVSLRQLVSALPPSQWLGWFSAAIYCAALITIAVGPYFHLKKFTCKTNTFDSCPDFIVPELAKFQGELAYLVELTRLTAKLKANLPQAEEVKVYPVWPDTLEAEIIIQHPIANIGIPASTSALLVGSNDQILSLSSLPDPTLPMIVASSAADLIISDHISEPSLKAALEIIKQFSETDLKTLMINVLSPQDIRVELTSGKTVIFTSLKPVPQQVRTLQLILSQATINPELPVIDIRYDRPALKPSL